MGKQIYIDATNIVAGRLGSYAAKQALLGNTIKIFNCEKAVMTGRKREVQEKYHNFRKNVGQPQKGPVIYTMPDRFVRRIIRGMLPYKQTRGREAYDRIMCYIGVPSKFEKEKMETLDWANASKLTMTKVQTIAELCKTIGWKGGSQ